MTRRLLIFCNAFDDETRIERGVMTDSPAGSRKVFQLALGLRKNRIRPWVLSLGRGRAGGKPGFFKGFAQRIEGVPVIYAPFSTVPWLSELISVIAFVPIVFRLRKSQAKSALFYNRMLAYVPALLMCAFCGYRRFLDFEDGEFEIGRAKFNLGVLFKIALRALYDSLCSSGVILACSALRGWTSIRPSICYYGTALGDTTSQRFQAEKLTILMGGALLPDTGADLLVQAIQMLRTTRPSWAKNLRFEVTGQGVSLERFRELELGNDVSPYVRVHGRTTDAKYREILARCDVGLALKLNYGALAQTTFPSKVIEYAAAGLLVLTTDISDVRYVLGDRGGLFIDQDDPELLCMSFFDVIADREKARAIAANGLERVRDLCDLKRSGLVLSGFLFNEP